MATSQRENPCLRCPELFKFLQSLPCLSELCLFDLLPGVEKTFCTVKPKIAMTFYKNLCPGVMKFTISVVIITINLSFQVMPRRSEEDVLRNNASTHQHKNPWRGGHEIYNFCRPFLIQHNHIASLSDLCSKIKNIFKEIH